MMGDIEISEELRRFELAQGISDTSHALEVAQSSFARYRASLQEQLEAARGRGDDEIAEILEAELTSLHKTTRRQLRKVSLAVIRAEHELAITTGADVSLVPEPVDSSGVSGTDSAPAPSPAALAPPPNAP